MLIEELLNQVKDGSILSEARPLCADSFFLDRIKEYEDVNRMHSFVFMERYDAHDLDMSDASKQLEFAEWYMLCQRYSEQIEEGIAIMASPPSIEDSVLSYEARAIGPFVFANLNHVLAAQFGRQTLAPRGCS